MDTFEEALRKLINECSMEKGSDTPDFILAQYMKDCLDAFDRAVKERSNWYKDNPCNIGNKDNIVLPEQPSARAKPQVVGLGLEEKAGE